MTEHGKQFLTELKHTPRTYVHVAVRVLREAIEEAQFIAVEATVTRIVEELVNNGAVPQETLDNIKQLIAEFRAEKSS